MKIFTKMILVCTLSVAGAFVAIADDEALVKQTITNYVLGFYEGDVEKLEKALHPTLRKLGWGHDAADAPYRGPYSMTKDSAKDFAPKWAAKAKIGSEGHSVITVFEVMDKVASAKIEAHWGIDYFHLAKEDDGQWKIYNVIWQSYPDGKNR